VRLGTSSNLCNKGEVCAQRLSRFVVCLLCCFPLASAAQQKASDGSRILTLEKQWTEAYRQRDIAILSSLLAEDFVITVEDGSTYGKAGYISHSADSSVHVAVAELSDLRVRMHGNTAVVTGAYHEKGDTKGKPYEYHDRLTDVWMKTGSDWQVIASHYSVPLKQ
jgi:ketosteroid isomerase-like protein